MIKITQAHYILLVSTITSLIMTFVLSSLFTYLEHGFTDNFFFLWIKKWFIVFTIAYPTSLIIMHFVRKFVRKNFTII